VATPVLHLAGVATCAAAAIGADFLVGMPIFPIDFTLHSNRETMVPTGTDWIYEIKHDGYRLISMKARVRLFTRNGHGTADR
jgi:ATP-dependent DNA ligase